MEIIFRIVEFVALMAFIVTVCGLLTTLNVLARGIRRTESISADTDGMIKSVARENARRVMDRAGRDA